MQLKTQKILAVYIYQIITFMHIVVTRTTTLIELVFEFIIIQNQFICTWI